MVMEIDVGVSGQIVTLLQTTISSPKPSAVEGPVEFPYMDPLSIVDAARRLLERESNLLDSERDLLQYTIALFGKQNFQTVSFEDFARFLTLGIQSALQRLTVIQEYLLESSLELAEDTVEMNEFNASIALSVVVQNQLESFDSNLSRADWLREHTIKRSRQISRCLESFLSFISALQESDGLDSMSDLEDLILDGFSLQMDPIDVFVRSS